MQFEVDEELSLFLRDPATGRLVFNSQAIEALDLSPAELAKRGYPVNSEERSRGCDSSRQGLVA